jgi:glycerol uptake facilitator protein
MSQFAAELIGTFFLILLGNGVVANVVLSGTKGNSSGWIVITTGWALAVFVGVVISAPFTLRGLIIPMAKDINQSRLQSVEIR